MKASLTLSVTTEPALEELMRLILSEDYPEVFHCGHTVLAATEELEQSEDTRLLKSYMDGIYNAIERLFYKEKIVLFPYLEKHFSRDGKTSTVPAINTATEEGHRASRMILSFKTEISGSGPEAKSTLTSDQLLRAFQAFESAWRRLCDQREQLFKSFLN